VGVQGVAQHRLAIADDSCALPIQTEDTAPVKPGDTVELKDFLVTIGNASPTFNLMNVTVNILVAASSTGSGSVVLQVNDAFLQATT